MLAIGRRRCLLERHVEEGGEAAMFGSKQGDRRCVQVNGRSKTTGKGDGGSLAHAGVYAPGFMTIRDAREADRQGWMRSGSAAVCRRCRVGLGGYVRGRRGVEAMAEVSLCVSGDY